jgi:hypothetical protein
MVAGADINPWAADVDLAQTLIARHRDVSKADKWPAL